MLIETSIQDLITSTNQIDTTARQHVYNEVQIVGGYQTTQVGNDLIFQCRTNTGHTPKIRIVNVEESSTPLASTVITTGGKQLLISPIPKTSQTYISCDCEDFVYRFAVTDQQRGVLFGKITRPTIPKTNRATQNLGKMGVCKHLLKFVAVLTNDGILT